MVGPPKVSALEDVATSPDHDGTSKSIRAEIDPTHDPSHTDLASGATSFESNSERDNVRKEKGGAGSGLTTPSDSNMSSSPG